LTATLISLISVCIGIFGGVFAGAVFKHRSNGLIGNVLAGVFGSIFFIKSIGRLGFDPMSIVGDGTVNMPLFVCNILVSFLGGIVGVVVGYKLRKMIA